LLGAFHSFALTAITPAQRSLSQHCVIHLCNAESRLIFSILHYYFYCNANDLIKHHESSSKTCCFRVHALTYRSCLFLYSSKLISVTGDIFTYIGYAMHRFCRFKTAQNNYVVREQRGPVRVLHLI
jgi:hypothetical protein